MKRNVTLIVFFIASILLFSACSSSQLTNEQKNIVERTAFEQMQDSRIQFVGDNKGVSRLLGFLPVFDENYKQRMFSLQTQSEPHGIIIFYEPSEQWSESSMIISKDISIYSDYLFECIDNLGYIEFKYRISNSNGILEESEYQLLSRVDRK